MKYTVILTEGSDDNVFATVPGLPECSVQAKTRNEALSLVRNTVTTIIRRSEIVQIDLPVEPRAGGLHHSTPWELFGSFKDDQTWGKLFDEIEYGQNDVDD